MKLCISAALICAAIALGAPCSRADASGTRARQAAALPYTWKFPSYSKESRWSTAKGVLSYDGTANGTVVAPVKIPAGSAFAVQAQIKLGDAGPFNAILMGAGIFAQQTPGNVHTMVDAGEFSSGNSESDNDGPELAWDMTTAGGESFNAGSGWHTYRLEVRGPQYTLLIDGKQMVQHFIPTYARPTRVGIFGAYFGFQARNFQVLALTGGAVTAPASPPFPSMVLGIGDLPTDTYFYMGLQHFYANVEIARIRNETLAAVNASGRVAGYGEDIVSWSPKYSEFFNTISQYQTAQQASADVPVLKAASAGLLPSTVTDIRDFPGTAGQVSAGIMFESRSGVGSDAFTFSVLYFAQGAYVSELIVITDDSLVSESDNIALTVKLAGVVAGRIQQNG